MRLVGCIRVSRVGGREGATFISPDTQRDQIKAYARAHGHRIVGWQEDLDKPGSTLNRPGLQAALQAIDAGEADGLIAAKLDRVTRSIADLGKLLHRAADGGWNLVAVDVGLDLGTTNGKLVAHVLGAIAEWELDRRRAEWENARARAVARGVHVASRTPTGYRRRPDGILEEDTAAAAAIRELFKRRSEGDGWATLANFLTSQGLRTPYGNETWTPAAASKMIHNRVYLGEARSGGFVLKDAHPALVDVGLWQSAQTPRLVPTARTAEPALLSGLVRCGSCRYVAKADSMRDRDGSRLALYRCKPQHAAGRCPQPVTILGRILDPLVEQRFLDGLRGNVPTLQAAKATVDLDAALAEERAAEAELLAYISSEALAIVGRSVFEHGLRQRRETHETAGAKVAELRSRVVTIGKLTPTQLLDAWPDLTVLERRELIAAAFDAIVVWPHQSGRLPADRVLIVPLGESPGGLPQRGRRVPLAPWPNRPRDVGMPAPHDPDERVLDSA
jgi:DNA invertase Pin-like site-specific DNA recombinase